MKNLALAAAFSVAATASFAGGMAEPMMEDVMKPMEVVEVVEDSSGGWLVPLLVLLGLAAAVSAN